MDNKQKRNEVFSDRFRQFLVQQNQSWELSEANYRGLDNVEEKEFQLDECRIKVQFNPERMRSSAAKVDRDAIAARKCFLCPENRPSEQKSLDMGHDFLLLVNPFPIFQTHFTLPSIHHINQRLIQNLDRLFEMAREMEGFTLFYNGPECGASAPDHLHFQAGENGFMPVEAEYEILKQSTDSLLFESDHLEIRAFGNYLRKMISVETDSKVAGIKGVENLFHFLQDEQPEKVEPLLNLLCYFKDNRWIIHLFPRRLHRPWQFFEQGELQLLISPASVDLGGVFITPRREDFEKITAADIVDIFSQISIDQEAFENLKLFVRHYKIKFTN